jgi:UDP-GlcNAc:undecaprenyl-phosphate GlcNAc-1-phosphate transferase
MGGEAGAFAVAHSTWLWLLTVLVSAFGIGLLATFLTREAARRIGFVAKPRQERWHSRPTALAGGVGIFTGFIAVSAVVGGEFRLPILGGAAAMFALGFVDDIVHLKPYAKLTGQILIAAVTTTAGQTLLWTDYTIVNEAITIFWLIGISNAINLLDNMDGLAGGIACVSAIFQALFFLVGHRMGAAALCTALAGSLLGFLVFNFNPASIFMGDSGSLFLGYSLANLALYQTHGRSRNLVAIIAVPVLVLLIPIFDTTFVTVTRLAGGRPVSQGGRDHTSHRMVTLGLTERKAVATLWGIAVMAGGIALLARIGATYAAWIGLPLLCLALAFVGIHLSLSDRSEPSAHSTPLASLAAFAYKRRLLEILLDVVLASVAFAAAFLLRYDGDIPDPVLTDMVRVFPLLIGCKIASLYFTGVYSGVWRYAGVRDLLGLVRGALVGSAVSVVLIALWLRFGSLSRGAVIIDGLLFATFVAGSRLSFRILHVILGGHAPKSTRKVLLWGAGDTGESIARQLLENAHEGLSPVGFIDDDGLKLGRAIHGIRVLGRSSRVRELVQNGVADEVLITSDQIDHERIKELAALLGPGKVRRLRFLLEDVGVDSNPPRENSGERQTMH